MKKRKAISKKHQIKPIPFLELLNKACNHKVENSLKKDEK